MARQEQIVIQSRLGEQIVDKSKIIYFPKGIIGFENVHEFTLLQIREGAPMLLLQSIDEPKLGLLVADPYSFLPEFSLKVGDAEQKLLCLETAADATVLVTVTIPPGKPHLTSLNLTGPILVNANKKFGLQVPQSDTKPGHVVLESLISCSEAKQTFKEQCNKNATADNIETEEENSSQENQELTANTSETNRVETVIEIELDSPDTEIVVEEDKTETTNEEVSENNSQNLQKTTEENTVTINNNVKVRKSSKNKK